MTKCSRWVSRTPVAQTAFLPARGDKGLIAHVGRFHRARRALSDHQVMEMAGAAGEGRPQSRRITWVACLNAP